jgi:hypothetical protein
MKHSNLLPENNKMPIIRIAPVCNGKIYVTPRSVMDNESSRMDLPMEECVEHVSTQSDKTARKVKEKYHQHLRTDAYPRFCVKHRSSTEKEAIIYLYVLPFKSEDEILFREGKFVTSEDISKHPEVYSPDLQVESELLGMAAELWDDFYSI